MVWKPETLTTGALIVDVYFPRRRFQPHHFSFDTWTTAGFLRLTIFLMAQQMIFYYQVIIFFRNNTIIGLEKLEISS